MMTVDNNPASPHYGRMYVGFADGSLDTPGRPTTAKERIQAITYSDDGTTWSTPVQLSDSGFLNNARGSWPAIAPNGDVYVSWDLIHDAAGTFDIQVARSTDGGAHFTRLPNPVTGAVQPFDAAATAACSVPALKGSIRYLPFTQLAVGSDGCLDPATRGRPARVGRRRSHLRAERKGDDVVVADLRRQYSAARRVQFHRLRPGSSSPGAVYLLWSDARDVQDGHPDNDVKFQNINPGNGLCGSLVVTPCSATVAGVSRTFSSVQAAVNAAPNGGTVTVSCPVVSSDGGSLAEGGSREESGEPGEGASTSDSANGGSDAHPSTDATWAVDGELPDVALGEASEPSDAPPRRGDASECMVDSDCGPGQWCVQYNTALGPAILTHYRCVAAICTTLDCSCAQSMCDTGYNCVVDAGRLVCQDLTGV